MLIIKVLVRWLPKDVYVCTGDVTEGEAEVNFFGFVFAVADAEASGCVIGIRNPTRKGRREIL